MDLISLILIIYVIGAHYFADFVFQDEKWAVAKRHSIKALLKHTITYTSVLTILLIGILYFINPIYTLYFFIFNFVTHTMIDYVTSRIVGQKFDNKEFGSSIPNFGAFSIIGFDQVLHYICIFGSLYLLT